MMMMEVLSTIYDDDDFIDINLCFSSSSPLPKHRSSFSRDDFEFQITSSSSSSLINTFHDRSADELFHRGKLLPLLHLQKPTSPPCRADQETNTFHHAMIPPANTETLLDEDYCFFEWSNDVHHHRQQQFAEKPSKNWSKRFYHKALNASKKYLRSLFTKPSICKVFSNSNQRKLLLSANKAAVVTVENVHRKSFSFSGTIFSSSSFSSSSSSSTPTMPRSSLSTLIINKPDNAAFQKKSSSAGFDIENSIEGAIAYCKRSHAV